MQLVTLSQIKEILPTLDLLPALEAGFVAYSADNAVVPPVGELLLEKGEVHIKYGYIKEQEYYVIKIASGFFDNPQIGLPTSNGLMLLFSQQTGELLSVLHDEGFLTDTRTAVAGAIAAKHLAPSHVERIGIVGTGIQARMQLEHLHSITRCRDVLVWGRSNEKIERYCSDMGAVGYAVRGTMDSAEILQTCNLIVTTTSSTNPLLQAADLRPGTHISAIGSDTPHKQELDAAMLAKADVVVADSISQCLARGEIYQAIQQGQITAQKPIELGRIIAGHVAGRTDDSQITIFDSTGVAVQDIQIATAVFEALCGG